MVHITGYEIECLLSNSFALEQLELKHCSDIICLKIPCLQWLSHLEVLTCIRLKVIESKAPNLSSFRFSGGRGVQLLLGETLRVKRLERICSNMVPSMLVQSFHPACQILKLLPYTRKLRYIFFNFMCLLTKYAYNAIIADIDWNIIRFDIFLQKVNTPMVPSRFHHLKFLSISLCGQSYDYFSLVSFFDASPSLESFFLNVSHYSPCKGRVCNYRSTVELLILSLAAHL